MTLHPLTSKGGACVLKLGLVFNKKGHHASSVLFIHSIEGDLNHTVGAQA